MLYRHYHIQYTTNNQGEYRWIIDHSDEVGENGFENVDDAKRYVNKLMKDKGKEDKGFFSFYPEEHYIRD